MHIRRAEISEIVTTGTQFGKVRPFSISTNEDGTEQFIGTGAQINIPEARMYKCTIEEDHYDCIIRWYFLLLNNDIKEAYPIYAEIKPKKSSNIPYRDFEEDYHNEMGTSFVVFPNPISHVHTVLNGVIEKAGYVTLPEKMIENMLASTKNPQVKTLLLEKQRQLHAICENYVNEMPYCLSTCNTSILAKEITDLCEMERQLTRSNNDIAKKYFEAFIPVLRTRSHDWRLTAVTNNRPFNNSPVADHKPGTINIAQYFRLVPQMTWSMNPDRSDNSRMERLHADVENTTHLIKNPFEYEELYSIYLILRERTSANNGYTFRYTLLNSNPIILTTEGPSPFNDAMHCNQDLALKLTEWMSKHYPTSIEDLEYIQVNFYDEELTIRFEHKSKETVVVFIDFMLAAICSSMIVYP